MTLLEQNLLFGSFLIIITGIGWLIKIQTSTNKSFAEAVTQFKTAIAIISVENKNQRENCIMHSDSFKERKVFVDQVINEIKDNTTDLIQDVIIIKKDIIDIKEDIVDIKTPLKLKKK